MQQNKMAAWGGLTNSCEKTNENKNGFFEKINKIDKLLNEGNKEKKKGKEPK